MPRIFSRLASADGPFSCKTPITASVSLRTTCFGSSAALAARNDPPSSPNAITKATRHRAVRQNRQGLVEFTLTSSDFLSTRETLFPLGVVEVFQVLGAGRLLVVVDVPQAPLQIGVTDEHVIVERRLLRLADLLEIQRAGVDDFHGARSEQDVGVDEERRHARGRIDDQSATVAEV